MNDKIVLTFYLRNFSELTKPRWSLINVLLSYFSTIADRSFFIHFSLKGLCKHFYKLYKVGWSMDGVHKMPYLSRKDIIAALKILDHNKDIIYVRI